MKKTKGFTAAALAALIFTAITATPVAAAPALSLDNLTAGMAAGDYVVTMNGKTYEPGPEFSTLATAAPGCSTGDADTKNVAAYQRRSPDGVAILLCGNNDFGWRHITNGKASSWGGIVTKYGLDGTWHKFAKWAMLNTLGAPATVTTVAGNKWNYKAPIQIKSYNGKAPSRTYTVTVSVAKDSNRIITAFPS
jgi:hypothetical protein